MTHPLRSGRGSPRTACPTACTHPNTLSAKVATHHGKVDAMACQQQAGSEKHASMNTISYCITTCSALKSQMGPRTDGGAPILVLSKVHVDAAAIDLVVVQVALRARLCSKAIAIAWTTVSSEQRPGRFYGSTPRSQVLQEMRQ